MGRAPKGRGVSARMLWGPLTRLGLVVATVSAAADQALKLWLVFVFDLGARGVVPLTPFFDIVLIWNPGISYGLFQQEGAVGQWALFGVKVIAVAALWIWLARVHSRLAALALGLIIGGAIGNAVDRMHWPGVMDFALVYAMFGGVRFDWYVFNLADTVIVAGVAGLLYESLWGDGAVKAPRSGP
jgi:signal peptidase II